MPIAVVDASVTSEGLIDTGERGEDERGELSMDLLGRQRDQRFGVAASSPFNS
jgi:hypothetical protein